MRITDTWSKTITDQMQEYYVVVNKSNIGGALRVISDV